MSLSQVAFVEKKKNIYICNGVSLHNSCVARAVIAEREVLLAANGYPPSSFSSVAQNRYHPPLLFVSKHMLVVFVNDVTI